MELMQANHQWANRPADERFTSIPEMLAHFRVIKGNSKQQVVASRLLQVEPAEDNVGMLISEANGNTIVPTHFAFEQLAQLGKAPPGYLRTLPSPIAADCVNYGLQIARQVEDVGILLQRSAEAGNPTQLLRAATGPNYGRIWNSEILDGLYRTFGDGIKDTHWRVPGEFGKAIEVTKDNTTLFAGDRDMFVFLADEVNRIEIPNRRDGKPGTLARGFFCWNSEVGSTSFGLSTFLFDYACSNRIVWGATDVKTIRMRHSKNAPIRFIEEMAPALESYSRSSASSIVEAVTQAQKKRIASNSEAVEEFLAKRFTKALAEKFNNTHILEEGRPIETFWDASTAITAFARSSKWQDERVALERKAGELLSLAQ